MTLVSLIAGAQLQDDVNSAATLMRWANLMMHMYYVSADVPTKINRRADLSPHLLA